jgi:hypothetical protein
MAVGLVYATWLWRWWALPIGLFLLSGGMLASTDLILNEGLSAPLALLLACFLSHFVALRGAGRLEMNQGLALVTMAFVAALAWALLAIRSPFAVFGLCPLAVAVGAHRTGLRRRGWAIFSIYSVAAIAVILLLSFENKSEYGEFSPNTGGARFQYWAAWLNVFTHPGNEDDPRLSEFYDNGDPYLFVHAVDEMDVPYLEEAAIYETAVAGLLRRSGIGPWNSRFQSFVGALRAGRLNDMDSTFTAVLSSELGSIDTAIHRNPLAREEGAKVFADEMNEGQMPEAVITAPLALRFPLPSSPTIGAVVLPLAMLVHVWGATDRRTRLLSTCGMGVTLSYAAFLGYLRADNFRFMAPIIVFAVATACAVASIRVPGRYAVVEQ